MASNNANANSSKAAGASLLAGSDFEISWVIRGTEWSQGRLPMGWEAIANPMASGSGSSGKAAQELVAIQQNISTKADQTYVLRLQINQAIAAGSVLEVAWGDETVAVIKGEQVRPPQSLQLLLAGIDGSRALRLSTNRSSDFGQVNSLGLFAQPIEKPTPLDIGVTAIEGQVLRANTTQLKDADGLGTLNYQWQSKSSDGNSWNDISGATKAELSLDQRVVGQEVRLAVSYLDGGGTQEVVVSKPTTAVAAANRAPDAGGVKQLGSTDEDQTVVLTRTDLLRGSSDADRDALSVVNVQVQSGSGTLTPIDADNWSFKPAANWSGTVRFTYEISDGKARTPANAELTIKAVNDAPLLTGTPASLAAGQEDVVYTIKAADLLQGFSDVDGDSLSVTNLSASVGSLTNTAPGLWTLSAPKDFNGKVNLSFSVSDGQGALTPASQSFSLAPVNDAPESQTVRIDVETDSPTSVRLTQAQLLAGCTDVDGDALTVQNLRVLSAKGAIQNNGDGTWTLTTERHSNGDSVLRFDVSDGALNTQAQVIVNVVRKPVFATFNLVTRTLEGDEGGRSEVLVQRSGDLSTAQTVQFKLNGAGLSSSDAQLGTAVFAAGSTEARVEVLFEKDGRWEGLEKGQLVVDQVNSPNNVVCQWDNSTAEVCIRDLDSRHDGTGNHQSGNGVGSAGVLEQRLAQAEYGDGSNSPAGQDRLGARSISNGIFEQKTTELNKQDLSDFVWAWGQFIDHDIVATTGGSESFSIELPRDDILIQMDIAPCEPVGDEFTGIQYDSNGRIIQNPIRQTPSNHLVFTRSQGIIDENGIRQQKNGTTAFLDASVVYGSSEARANQLRSFAGGKLKIESNGLLTTEQQTEGIGFAAGDSRASENPLLSSLQTLWVREHNRITDELSKASPGLNDEQLYQRARVKVMGLMQNITYQEFLPALLGDQALSNYGGYNANTNPGIFNEFASAAYRFGHSMISETLARREHDGSTSAAGDIPLKDAFFNIQFLQQSGIDTVLRGASLQQAQETDSQYTDSLRNFLFSAPPEGSKCPMRGILRFANGAFPALDLASRNIQRGRDHGIADYNSVREAMGLERLTSFDQITSNKELANRLKELYNNDINNVDLYMGGLSEDHLEGSSMGELFSAIVVRQFEAIRDGDRFWFENSSNGLFTAQEIAEIKATRLSDVIERNTGITDLRDNVFLVSIKGTPGNDVLNGTHLADRFVASMGHDRIYGSDGEDTVDYSKLGTTVTLRFDGVLKGSNSLDVAGMSAWASLQDLASQGNSTAEELFKLHQGFFGHSISGFFNNEAPHEPMPAGGPSDQQIPVGLGFDQLNSIEVIKAAAGSTIDARGATEQVQADLTAGTFSTSFFKHQLRSLVDGFSNVFGSRLNDTIKGDQQNNVLLGLSGDDQLDGAAGVDDLAGGIGNDQLEGGEGTDTAHYSGALKDYKIWAEDQILHVQDLRSGNNRDGSDTLHAIEWLQFADQKVATKPYLNKAPVLQTAQAALADGVEDTAYSITAAQLLQGFVDPDGDPLSVADLKASTGDLKETAPGVWTLVPPKDFSGSISLSYAVVDDYGGKTLAQQQVSLAAVNDAPVVSGPVNLGDMNEDGSFRIWSDKLLANASDVDSDTLKVVDLKLTSGQGVITDNGDGSWNFAPSKDWSGAVSFSYGVSDGHSTTSLDQTKNLVTRGDSLYLLTENGSWTEAETRAMQLGGHLATINDGPENQFIWDQFTKHASAAWIGYNKESGSYTWSSGEHSTYTNWHPGCPDFSWEHYAHIALYQDAKGLGLWGDSDNFGTGNLGLGKGLAEIPFIRRGDSAYVVVQGPTWEQAEANAIKLGGHLVTINDAEENKWLFESFNINNNNWQGVSESQISSNTYWAGFSDQAAEGEWKWSSGEISTYSNWAAGEPNGGRYENSLHLGRYKDSFWNDAHSGEWFTTKGIAEIKLGSDFAVTQATATLKVNPENDYTTGDIGIDVIGDPSDAITSDNTSLQYSDFSGTGSSLNLGGSNPSALALTGDVLTGSIGSDSLMGTSENDILVGSLTGANSIQQDVLTGGAGHDLFVLGNSKGSFYSSQGFDDVARITDFDPTKDQLQMFGGNAYLTAGINKPDVVGTGVFNDVDRNGVIGAGDDLIAIVSNQNNPVELGRNNFKTV